MRVRIGEVAGSSASADNPICSALAVMVLAALPAEC